MRPGGREPLADPSVLAWDAVARGETSAPSGCDAAEFALLRRFHQLDQVPMPSAGFFADLEDHVRRLAPAVAPASQPDSAKGNRGTSTVSRSAARPISIDRALHRPSVWVAIAAVLAIVLAGVLVVYAIAPSPSEPPAIPAAVIVEPTMEPLLQFEFDPPQWGMPEATNWTHLDFSIIALAPGKSFDTDQGWYTSTDGPLLLSILNGELTITPGGPSLLYRAGARDQPAVENDPGQTITLEPGDGIVYSVHDAATGSNPGTEPMHALIGLTGSEDFEVPGAFSMPSDVRSVDENDVDGLPVLPTKGASVSIQRLRLAPYDLFVLDPAAVPRFLPALDTSDAGDLYMAFGAIDTLSPDLESQQVFSSGALRPYVAKPYTLYNLGEEPVDIYFFVVEPTPGTGTPTPQP